MAKINCSISGLTVKCDYVSMTLTEGGAHPIFFLPQKKLLGLASKYAQGGLTNIDSYLLFLALLHSTDAVTWNTPCKYTDKTPALVASNIGQLIRAIWRTNAITSPKFRQPKYVIREANKSLADVDAWIAAWDTNITNFKRGYTAMLDEEEFRDVERKLTHAIKGGYKDAKYASAVAEWAKLAGEFPQEVAKDWEAVIRRCFNPAAMFSTPKETLVAIKAHCEDNIAVGSIHFHTLMQVLKEGLQNHNTFLGLWDLDEDALPEGADKADVEKEATELAAIKAKAPATKPVERDYANKLSYLRAKMAYDLVEGDK